MALLKTLTKAEVTTIKDPLLNKLFGLDELIYQSQISGKNDITFNPAMIVPKDVAQFWQGSPYNFTVTSTTLPNQMVSITKISWV